MRENIFMIILNFYEISQIVSIFLNFHEFSRFSWILNIFTNYKNYEILNFRKILRFIFSNVCSAISHICPYPSWTHRHFWIKLLIKWTFADFSEKRHFNPWNRKPTWKMFLIKEWEQCHLFETTTYPLGYYEK